jgi:hypothetical protein
VYEKKLFPHEQNLNKKSALFEEEKPGNNAEIV